MKIRTAIYVALPLLLTPLAATIGEAAWDGAGNVELQSRFFAADAQWPGQSGQIAQATLAATAELRWRNAAGNQRASIMPYLRRDSVDDGRNLLDLKEAYWA